MLATAPSHLDTGTMTPHREADKHLLRELIQLAGLRSSMPRLKVMAALYSASDVGFVQEKGISGWELHQQLNSAGVPLCLASVRDVLRRLDRAGLVQWVGRDRYCLTPPVMQALTSGQLDKWLTAQPTAAPVHTSG